jgi:hypothetical protein
MSWMASTFNISSSIWQASSMKEAMFSALVIAYSLAYPSTATKALRTAAIILPLSNSC